MSENAKITTYFNSAAWAFDSLYGETRSNFLMRFLNRKFRKDIYERFAISLEHAEALGARSVLDVGCGSGRYALAFAELGLEIIVGIDCSRIMIDLANRITSGWPGREGLFQFTCTDFMSFVTDRRFDLVLAMGVFDYVKDPVPFLSKMISLSNHSVVASFPSMSVYRTPIRKARYYMKKCPVYFYDEKQIQTIFAEAGFRGVEIKKIPGAGMDYVAILKK
jgi:2-polyprenyl-3-methyl-5-hydroxy-6-metoxy-1,4-benzoquinol methylase